MKKGLIAGLLLAAGVASANAADLAVKAPAIAPAPFSWTGFYIGAHAGGGVLFDAGWTPGIGAAADRHGIGALAGGQIGANYQTGMLVLGIEAEGFWSGMRNTANFYNQFGAVPNQLIASAHVKNKWDADVAARFGLAVQRALVYGKVGYVWGGFDWDYAQTLSFGGNPLVPTYTEKASANLDGLLIGIGLEYAFLNNWSAKFEYDYLGFANKDVTFTTAGAFAQNPPFNTYRQTVSVDKHIFKFGVNYLFNAGPIVAKY
jgi:outer membrane immunogenic protein